MPLPQLPQGSLGPDPAVPDGRCVGVRDPARLAGSLPVVAHGTRSFCENCGSPLTYANAAVPGEIDVMTYSLDDPDAFPPRFKVWLDHAQAWLNHDDGLPAFARTGQD